MITFEQYVKNRGIELVAWQKDFARAVLKGVHTKQYGKTFLINWLQRFLDDYENCFGLDGKPEPQGPTVINDMYSEKEIAMRMRYVLFLIDDMSDAPDELYDEVRRLSAMLERVREASIVTGEKEEL